MNSASLAALLPASIFDPRFRRHGRTCRRGIPGRFSLERSARRTGIIESGIRKERCQCCATARDRPLLPMALRNQRERKWRIDGCSASYSVGGSLLHGIRLVTRREKDNANARIGSASRHRFIHRVVSIIHGFGLYCFGAQSRTAIYSPCRNHFANCTSLRETHLPLEPRACVRSIS